MIGTVTTGTYGSDVFTTAHTCCWSDGGIHMPPPSYWPILLALALTFMLSGVLISTYQIIAGGLLVLYCMFKFALEYHRPAQEAH